MDKTRVDNIMEEIEKCKKRIEQIEYSLNTCLEQVTNAKEVEIKVNYNRSISFFNLDCETIKHAIKLSLDDSLFNEKSKLEELKFELYKIM